MQYCKKCNGTGKIFELGKEANPCFCCHGTGNEPVTEKDREIAQQLAKEHGWEIFLNKPIK